jgi:hypothetical protein
MFIDEMDSEEYKFFNLISGFSLRDIQACLQIKKHLETNGLSVDDLENFFEFFSIKGHDLKRKK